MGFQMGVIFSLIGALTGIFGMLFSIIGFLHNRMLAVTSYLEYTREPEFIESRRFVWELMAYDSKSMDEDSEKAYKIENIINTYNMIGLLVRKHQLPKWFFKETSTGDMVIQLYDKLRPYITYRREKHEIKTYANQFEYLYMLIATSKR
ncbi:MAG: DUF4760 domain-containing protein [Oscillospiraceae bacterium]|nr:DUF4760 domain-containing protein [Oscillospiraceae bacterium]